MLRTQVRTERQTRGDALGDSRPFRTQKGLVQCGRAQGFLLLMMNRRSGRRSQRSSITRATQPIPFDDGAMALSSAAEENPDLLITEVIMPDMNGVDLAIHFENLYPKCKIL